MWPADVFNMGLLRSAGGRRNKCKLGMDAYRFKQHIWGRCPLVLELGDPLQMRPVRTVSLFDSQDTLKQRVAQGADVSIESQWGIKAFNIFDYAFELTETKRFVSGNPIIPFLQSLRDADSASGRVVDADLWNLFQCRCVKQSESGTGMKDPRLQTQAFQAGYCVSYYWQATVRFFFARARREAQLLSVPLVWIQASDDIKGVRRTAQARARQSLGSAFVCATGIFTIRHTCIHYFLHALVSVCASLRRYQLVIASFKRLKVLLSTSYLLRSRAML